MTPGIHIFDVDHTIIRRSSGRRFAILAIRGGMFPIRLLLLIPFYYLYYRYGNMKISFIDRKHLFLKGIPKKAFEHLADKSFKKYLRKDIYPGAVSLIRSIKSSGTTVVLATSSPDIIVRPLADYLSVEEVLATSIEFKKGLSTGRFKGVPLFEREKKKQVLSFIVQKGYRPEDCTFYSDSIHDLPLLKAVGFPVVVNPDHRLRLAARKRGWKILKFS